MPDPILVGRNAEKVAALAKAHGIERWTTDLDAALANPNDTIYFDAGDDADAPAPAREGDRRRQARLLREADRDQPRRGAEICRLAQGEGRQERRRAGQAVPARPAQARACCATRASSAASCRCAASSATGCSRATGQPAQRPSWNYRAEDGGGIILDMFCHWRYVLDNLFGEVQVGLLPRRHAHPRARSTRAGKPYEATADDAAYATFELEGGVIAQINSSWAMRVYRDDLVTFQVDGTTAPPSPACSDCVHPAPRRHAAPGLEPGREADRSTSTTAGRRCPTTRPTTTASRRSGRCSSATSSRTRPSARRCSRAPRACSSSRRRCKAGRSAAGSTCRRCRWGGDGAGDGGGVVDALNAGSSRPERSGEPGPTAPEPWVPDSGFAASGTTARRLRSKT